MKNGAIVVCRRVGQAVLMTILLSLSVRADQTRDEDRYFYCDFWINFSGSHYRDYGADWAYRRSLGPSQEWWVTQKAGAISGVRTSADMASMQGPVALTSSVIVALMARTTPYSEKAWRSPVLAVLLLPSSQLEYRFASRWYVGINNNTEYVFVRGHGGEKGIYYTSALGLSYRWSDHGGEIDVCDLQLLIGRTHLWSFERSSRSMGWTIGVMLRAGYYVR
jgi:hypothetical protein